MIVERVRVGEVLRPERALVTPDPTREYVAIGVRSFGRGIFHYEPKLGAELGSLRFFDVRAERLVVSNIKGWEGAIAVSGGVDDGCVASNRFLQYVSRDDRIDVRWACWFFLSEQGIALIQKASPGSADRNRTLAIDRFEALEIPLPLIDEQRRLSGRLAGLAGSVRGFSALHTSRLGKARAIVDAEVARTFATIRGRDAALGVDIEIVSGATPDSGNPAYWDGEICWVTPTDLGALVGRDLLGSARRITRAGFDSSSTQLVGPGTVVMSSRAPIGHLGIARVPLCTNQGCKTFVPPPNVQPEYLYWAIRSVLPTIRGVGTGTTFHEVSASRLRGITVRLPDRDTQEAVVAHLDGVNRLVDAALARFKAQGRRIAALIPAALNEAFAGLS